MTNSALFATHQAVLTTSGPEHYSWARGIRGDNTEETFIYGPDDKSFDIKAVPAGTLINTHHFRTPEKDGPTKWTTAALPLSLQTQDVKDCLDQLQVRFEKVEVDDQATQRKKFASPRFSLTRSRKIDQIIEFHQLSGKYAESEAIAHCIDLCIENSLV